MTELLAWAAGFIDGEGTIGVHPIKQGEHALRLRANGTDPEPLRRLQGLFGGSVTGPRQVRVEWKPIYQWGCYGANAVKALAEMLEFLTTKRAQAEVAIMFPPGEHRKPVSVEMQLVRVHVYDELKRLNRRGVS